MKKRIRIVLSLLAMIFIALLAFYALAPSEPSYAGRPLSSWLRQLDDGDREEGLSWATWNTNRTDKQEKAAGAIRQMGTNAVPNLLSTLTNRPSDLRIRIWTLAARQHWIKIPPPETNHLHRAAALAFDALGVKAKDAVPDLVAILKHPPAGRNDDSDKVATIALAAIDPEGRAELIRLVGSKDWSGTCAIWGLASHHAAVPPKVIETLIKNLTNNMAGNGSISGWALGELQQDPEHVIPALISAFSSKDLGTRWGAAMGLELWGTNATGAIPALSAGLNDPDSSIRGYAKRALEKIDPKRADKN
jgi:HEAT repeat protein